jgi:hypothetical protein
MPVPLLGAQMVSELSRADFNWTHLQKLAKLTFSNCHQETLLAHFNRFLEDLAREQGSPGEEEVRRLLEGYATSAGDLARLMWDRSAAGETALGYATIHYLGDLASLRHTLTVIARDASETLKALPRKAGRPKQKALHDLIRAWHGIYLEAGGTGPGCSWSDTKGKFVGKFLFLLHLACRQAAQVLTRRNAPIAQVICRSCRKRNALALSIKKALKERR